MFDDAAINVCSLAETDLEWACRYFRGNLKRIFKSKQASTYRLI
jgi:hypothetical protein